MCRVTTRTLLAKWRDDGIVLLKNDDGILPLNKPTSLAIIGYDAINNPDGINACEDRGCNNGTLAMGWGSGTAEYPVRIYLSIHITQALTSP
jgi:Glycosyl hydrolase family 3 C-terminal domain